jgi:hypothetical protein
MHAFSTVKPMCPGTRWNGHSVLNTEMKILRSFFDSTELCPQNTILAERSRTLNSVLLYCNELYYLNPWRRVLPAKLTVSQPVEQIPVLYGNRRFITAFKRARHLSLSWVRSIQSLPPSHILKIHFNIIQPSMPRPFRRSLTLRAPAPKFCMHLSCLR